MTAAPNQMLPWGTLIVVVGSAAAFVATGSAPDYGTADPDGRPAFPTIVTLLGDVFRHPDVFVLLATLLVIAPVAVGVERVVGAAGVTSVYLVAGLGAGFLEAARAVTPVPVAGAFGGTTALLAMWAVVRWRCERTAIWTGAVLAGWLLASFLRPGPFPLLGCGIALWVGLYAMDATPRLAERSEVRGR